MARVESQESSTKTRLAATPATLSDRHPPSALDSRLSTLDSHFLAHALQLAKRGAGRTAPNPSVGCVLVKDGQLLAAARTADHGRPHAETQTLAAAGDAAHGATAYVTLEPCAHHGQTPPCAEALIAAGITRVVIACADADARVNGRGIALLEAAGIAVTLVPSAHPLARECAAFYRGFFRRTRHGLPLVDLKLATSLDGRITDAAGQSQWITGTAARTHAHGLRAQYDALLTGIGTVLADDPQLTVRLPGYAAPGPIRIVCDRQLRLPLTSQLVRSAHARPVWVFTTTQGVEGAASHATDLREAGVTLHALEAETFTPHTVLNMLGNSGINQLLVEAGSRLSTAFLAADCVDRLHWYRAPVLLGSRGVSGIEALDTALPTLRPMQLVATTTLAPDRYEEYERTSCLPD